MKKLLITLLILILPCLCFAEWSTPIWTDDCTITVKKDKDGRVIKWTETCYGEDAKQTSKRVEEYTYYGTGEVNEINQKVLDTKDALTSNKKIKHYTDGHEPTVSNISIGEMEVPK